MKSIYFLIMITGFIYFFLTRRRFDFLSLGFISACIYFMPGIFGYVIYPPNKQLVPLNDEVFSVYVIVLGGILLISILYDRFYSNKMGIKIEFNDNVFLFVTFLLTAVTFLLTIFEGGLGLLSPSKEIVAESTGRFHLAMAFFSSLLLIQAYLMKNKVATILALIPLVFNVYIGYRSTTVIVLLGVFTYLFYQQGSKVFLFTNIKKIIYALLFGLVVFAYKPIYTPIKEGNWDLVLYRLTNLDFYVESITMSEPFTTQAILNEIMYQNFQVSGEHMKGIFYLFAFFGKELGAENYNFYDLYQPVLFSNTPYGLANNIWAEMLSVGGYPLLIAFSLFFAITLALGSYLLSVKGNAFKTLVILGFSYWAFYIHRNEILFQLTLERRVLIFWAICIVLTLFISQVVFRKRTFKLR